MNVSDFISQIESADLTVGELSEITDAAAGLAAGAESRYAKVFDLGDTVRAEDGRIGTVVRRNVHTVSVLFRGAEDTEKVTPSSLVDILDVLDDPDTQFDYYEYFGDHVEEDASA
jgi:hypothetical protein